MAELRTLGEGLLGDEQAAWGAWKRWNVYVHSGYFYLNNRSYYLFADKGVETIPAGTLTLQLAQQTAFFAPVIITDNTSPWEDDTCADEDSPICLTEDTLSNK